MTLFQEEMRLLKNMAGKSFLSRAIFMAFKYHNRFTCNLLQIHVIAISVPKQQIQIWISSTFPQVPKKAEVINYLIARNIYQLLETSLVRRCLMISNGILSTTISLTPYGHSGRRKKFILPKTEKEPRVGAAIKLKQVTL